MTQGEKKLPDKHLKNGMVIQETLETELSFSRMLGMVASGSGIDRYFKDLALNQPGFQNAHKEFLKSFSMMGEKARQITELSEQLSNILGEINLTDPERLLSFVENPKFSEILDKYILAFQDYIQLYLTCLPIMMKFQEDMPSNLKEGLDEIIRQNQFQGQTISSLQIAGVQRLPRWALLLRELIKNTNEQHPQYAKLKELNENLLPRIQFINDSLGVTDTSSLVRKTGNLRTEFASIELIQKLEVKTLKGKYWTCEIENNLRVIKDSYGKTIFQIQTGQDNLVIQEIDNGPIARSEHERNLEILSSFLKTADVKAVKIETPDEIVRQQLSKCIQDKDIDYNFIGKEVFDVRIPFGDKNDPEKKKQRRANIIAQLNTNNFSKDKSLNLSDWNVIVIKAKGIHKLKNKISNKKHYVIKENGEPILRISVHSDRIKVKPVDNLILNNKQLDKLDNFMQFLAKDVNPPVINAENLERAKHLMGKGVYHLSDSTRQEAKALRKQQKAKADKNVSIHELKEFSALEVPINVNNKIEKPPVGVALPFSVPEDNQAEIINTFKTNLASGFIPVWDGSNGKLNGEVEINTPSRLLAIKQFEAALNAGLTPNIVGNGKKINKLVDERLKLNPESRQIEIKTTFQSGEELFNQIKHAVENGLLVLVDEQGTKKLQDYVGKLGESEGFFPELKSIPNPAVMFEHLVKMGILPGFPEDPKKYKNRIIAIQKYIKETEKPFELNSGSPARDFITLKYCLERGIDVSLPITVGNAFKKYVELQHPQLKIDLSKLSKKQQLQFAAKAAELGILPKTQGLDAKGQKMEIKSTNVAHIPSLFHKMIESGFVPTLSDASIRAIKAEYNEVDLTVTLSSNDPEVLIQQLQVCTEAKLMPYLGDLQIEALKKHLAKNGNESKITIASENHEIINNTMLLGVRLGLKCELTPQAKQAINNFPEVTPIKDKEGKVDMDQTLKFVKMLSENNIVYSIPHDFFITLVNMIRPISDAQKQFDFDVALKSMERDLKSTKGVLFRERTPEAKRAQECLPVLQLIMDSPQLREQLRDILNGKTSVEKQKAEQELPAVKSKEKPKKT